MNEAGDAGASRSESRSAQQGRTAGKSKTTESHAGDAPAGPLSATVFHVLMVLAEGPSYGYAIMKAVESHSGGAVAPDIGSMYRVLARLMAEGWVAEGDAAGDLPSSIRGRARRYYELTPEGRQAAHAEAYRLAEVLRLARARDLLPEGARP